MTISPLTFTFFQGSLVEFFPPECSKEKCRLLVTHDDYSITSKLPRDRTSVVTILRNPVDRVFSTYEFSVEVAARFLVHPNLTSATKMIGRLRAKTKGVSTLDIWPWKYLVPWMREDLFARVCFLYSSMSYYFIIILHFSLLFVLFFLHFIGIIIFFLPSLKVTVYPRISKFSLKYFCDI